MKWEGPYLIIDKKSDVVYRIQKGGPRGTKKVVHYDHLKPYWGNPLYHGSISWSLWREAAEEAPSLTLQSIHDIVTGNADEIQDLQQPSDDREMDTLSVDSNEGAKTAEL